MSDHPFESANLASSLTFTGTHDLMSMPLSFFTQIVHVNVGLGFSERKGFDVSQGLLFSVSRPIKEFFASAEEHATLQLYDTKADTFERFMAWLHTAHVVENDNMDRISWETLFEMYVFGESYIIPEFQNAVMDTLIRYSIKNERLPVTEIGHAWDGTLESSRLRTFLVDLYLYADSDRISGTLQNQAGELHTEFLNEVSIQRHMGLQQVNNHLHIALQSGEPLWLINIRSCHCKVYHIHAHADTACERLVL